ncbi:DUF3397 domain-containing protein [Lentibacillus amyloliquefaciens]|nr:DUF3397 domain-containing protein [Lentibacillus amyloliquefaciens]
MFVYVIGIIITIPVIATTTVYAGSKMLHNNKWKAFHAAVNWTTLLYIIAVIAMLKTIFESTFLSFILLMLLSLFTVIVVFHWKMYTEIVFNKIFKIFWRVCFLIFFLLYVLLIVIGTIIYIV